MTHSSMLLTLDTAHWELLMGTESQHLGCIYVSSKSHFPFLLTENIFHFGRKKDVVLHLNSYKRRYDSVINNINNNFLKTLLMNVISDIN